MTIEFKSTVPETLPPLAIVIDGVDCGTVEQKRTDAGASIGCHAVLRVRTAGGLNAGLAQGWGDSPANAVADAFARSRAEARDYLNGLEALEERYWRAVGAKGGTRRADQ